MKKKIKQNRYKPDQGASVVQIAEEKQARTKMRFAVFMAPVFMIFLSLGAILAHDLVTQSPLFMVKKVVISGNQRVDKNEVLDLVGLKDTRNIFAVNVHIMKKQIESHPWISRACVERSLFSTLVVRLVEERPLAIVNIENMTRILINSQGKPFKEYDPETDKVDSLPVISGVDLTLSGNSYQFEGRLFNSIMNFLKYRPDGDNPVINLNGDEDTGLIVHARDIYNAAGGNPDAVIRIKLGFDRFAEKLLKAKEISTYIGKTYPDTTICAMDLFDIEKVFIKIKTEDALHNSMEKGV